MKIKNFFLQIIILPSICTQLNAQINSITGTIYNKKETPLPYASVTIKADNGNKIVSGVVSDSAGQFELKSIVNGGYLVTIKLVGYKLSETHVDVTGNVDMGNISLFPDTSFLNNVVVTAAAKSLVSRKADRYILNVGQSILSSGHTTFDMLNYAPGVMTVGNGIAINGNTATKIMVNGRLLRLSEDQIHNYLANLRADDVESMEIIPVPGAEFEAEGSGGIINIKLKKKRTAGLSGSLGLGAGTPEWPTYNTREELDYGAKGLQLYASHSYNHSNSYGNFSDDRSFNTQTYNLVSHAEYNSHANNYRFGAGYDFDNNHYLGIEFNGNNNVSNNTSLSNGILNDPANNQQKIIDGNFLTNNNNKLQSLSLNYNWNLDTLGSALKLNADYTWARYYSSGNFKSHYENFNGDFLFDSIYLNQVPLNVDNYDIGIDYNKNWKKAGTLNLGAKYTRTHTLNDVRYQYFNNGKYVTDSSRTNLFDYTENIAAAYAQYAKEWQKTSIQIGLRAENTHTVGISPTTGIAFKKDYFNLFPSAFIKQDLSDKHTISFSYSYRLNRPTFNYLNPFELRMDDYTYVKGNPQLAPQFTHSLQLSYLFNKKYDVTFFAQFTKDPFGQPLSNGGTNSIISEYLWQNMNYNNNYGVNIYLPFKIAKWWNMTNNLLVYHNILSYASGENEKTIFQGKTTQSITVKKSWRFELSGYYQSSYNQNNLIYVPNYSVDAGLNKSVFKDKLNIRVLAADIFNTDKMDYKSIGSNLVLSEKQKYLTRKFSLQLIYNFKLGKSIQMKKVEAGNETEKGRIQ